MKSEEPSGHTISILKINGIITGTGSIEFGTARSIAWNQLSELELPGLPPGSRIELAISMEDDAFLSGKAGIVWATYDIRQAEIIRNALKALQVSTEIKRIHIARRTVYLTVAVDRAQIDEAIDFIWKSESGLRLRPDWSYPEGKANESLERWLSGQ